MTDDLDRDLYDGEDEDDAPARAPAPVKVPVTWDEMTARVASLEAALAHERDVCAIERARATYWQDAARRAYRWGVSR